MKKYAYAFCLLSAVAFQCAFGQLKIVDGRIYNPETSSKWFILDGEVWSVEDSYFLLRETTKKNIYGPVVRFSQNQLGRIGGAGGIPPYRPIIGEETIYGKTLFVVNPNNNVRVQGNEAVKMWAMSTGASTNMSGFGNMNIWTIGRDPTPEELRQFQSQFAVTQSNHSNAMHRVAAAKAEESKQRILRFQLEQASNGFPGFQYIVGMRYLRGDGVPTNRTEATRWLKLAAAQGHKDAEAELTKLTKP